MIILNPGDNLTLKVPESFTYAKQPGLFLFTVDTIDRLKRGCFFYTNPSKKQLKVMFDRITRLCGPMTPDADLRQHLVFKPDGNWWHYREYVDMELRADYRHGLPVLEHGELQPERNLVWHPRAVFTVSDSLTSLIMLTHGYQSGKYYDHQDQEVE